ncbi:MAG TPA: FHA domain-containing protein [Polyangiaceae bacterium]|nr:FHA domain-containing protein [Polyangiaceae bacterium]
MVRFRLRFLLQEIDLPQGETLIGRSTACHITLEDPLVSRTHARITVADDQAVVEDLGSRNGLLINGERIQGPTSLSDGSRIRVGTQEFVLGCILESQTTRKIGQDTGFLCHCAACGLPYPNKMSECPNCGSKDRFEEDTLSGSLPSREAWTLDLVVETVRKARQLGRWADVDRLLRRASDTLEHLLAAGEPVDGQQLDALADAAVSLSVATGQAEWGRWVLGVFASLGLVPGKEVGRGLSSLPPAERHSLAPVASRVLESAGNIGRGAEEGDALDEMRLLAAGGQ